MPRYKSRNADDDFISTDYVSARRNMLLVYFPAQFASVLFYRITPHLSRVNRSKMINTPTPTSLQLILITNDKKVSSVKSSQKTDFRNPNG